MLHRHDLQRTVVAQGIICGYISPASLRSKPSKHAKQDKNSVKTRTALFANRGDEERLVADLRDNNHEQGREECIPEAAWDWLLPTLSIPSMGIARLPVAKHCGLSVTIRAVSSTELGCAGSVGRRRERARISRDDTQPPGTSAPTDWRSWLPEPAVPLA